MERSAVPDMPAEGGRFEVADLAQGGQFLRCCFLFKQVVRKSPVVTLRCRANAADLTASPTPPQYPFPSRL